MIFNYAKAYIKGSKEYPGLHGTVYFKESNSGTLLTAQIYGLPQSEMPCKCILKQI